MRILLISGRYPPIPCGIGDQTQRLASTLAKRGHQVSIFTSRNTAIPRMTEPEGVRVFREAVSWGDEDRAAIAGAVQRQNAEIVHIQYHANAFRWHPMVTTLPLRLKKMSGPAKLRVVVTPHDLSGPIRFLPSPVRRAWMLPLLLSSDGIVVTTERFASLLRRLPLLRREPIHIPLGSSIDVSPDADRRVIRKGLGVGENDFFVVRFGFVRNPEIGFFKPLLQAVRLLMSDGRRIKLLFVGSENPGGREFVLSCSKSLGIANCVFVKGYSAANEVSGYLASADAAAQLYPDGVRGSRSALVAALLHGVPTLAFRAGGVPSWLHHEENIFLVPSRKPSALAGAFARLMSDPKLREHLSRNAPKAVSRWERIAEQTEQFYENLMKTA